MSASLAQPVLAAASRSEKLLSVIDEMNLGGDVEFFMESGRSQTEDELTVHFQSRFDYDFNPNVRINAEAVLSAGQKGTSQQLYARKQGEAKAFELLSMYGAWTWRHENSPLLELFHGFTVETRAGILNQHFLKAPMLISKWGFIGLMEELTWSRWSSSYLDHASLVFQQVLPYSTTDLIYQEQAHKTTWLFTGSLFLEKNYQEMIFNKGSFTGFYFKDLSPDTARIGRILGNKVVQEYTGADSQFPFPFYGMHFQLQTYLDLFEELDVEFRTAFLWNLGEFENLTSYDEFFKISGNNKARSFFIGFHIPIPFKIQFTSSLEYFDIRSSAAPAFYNDSKYGHANRHGFIIGAKMNFEKYGFYLSVQYGVIRSYREFDPFGHPNYISMSIGREYDGQI